MKSTEKWPTFFRVEKISESVVGDVFVLYMVIDVFTKNQLEEVVKVIDLQKVSSNPGCSP